MLGYQLHLDKVLIEHIVACHLEPANSPTLSTPDELLARKDEAAKAINAFYLTKLQELSETEALQLENTKLRAHLADQAIAYQTVLQRSKNLQKKLALVERREADCIENKRNISRVASRNSKFYASATS
jgi:regulator of replication initiation timing